MPLALHSYFDGISYDKNFFLRLIFKKKGTAQSEPGLSSTATVSGNAITNQN
jgi:hypothetical protein